MKVATVNISFQKQLLAEIDRVADEESRSRSELLREAARIYVERKKRWEKIFSFGQKQAKRLDLEQDDINSAIRSYRKKTA